MNEVISHTTAMPPGVARSSCEGRNMITGMTGSAAHHAGRNAAVNGTPVCRMAAPGGVSKLAHPLLTYHKARTFTSTGFAIP